MSSSNKQHAVLSDDEVRAWIHQNVSLESFAGKRVLLVVPDATRTAPLPMLFETIYEMLKPIAEKVDLIVALGTHAAMKDKEIRNLLGITKEERNTKYADVGMFNHEWDNPEMLTTLGVLTEEETEEISSGILSMEVPVQINKRTADYDTLFVIGPVFPHEVVGFSGGNKYFFPGISGPMLLNFFHWLGALITNVGIIGIEKTPVRKVVDKAATLIPNETCALTFVVSPDARLYGLAFGSPEEAWETAAKLSSQVHMKIQKKPYKQILSCAPLMYDELWTAGKCMYKLEPVVADGGELIIYAPHLSEISVMHGKWIKQIGYHVRDYFVKQWDKFKDVPWGVLAHSTHVRGCGEYDAETGVESPRVKVTLASQIPKEECEAINLGYLDPKKIDIESFANREEEGILLVRKAGEHLYRLEDDS